MPATFELHEIAAGVWGCVAPGMAGPAVSNAAIIDLGDKTVVVDTFMTVAAADEMAHEAQRLTGRETFLVVNSHWHSDHVGGNSAFGTAPIVGTRRMKELIVEDAPATPEEFARRVAEIEANADALAAKAETAQDREVAAGTRALADALSAQPYRLTLPSVLIGDRLDIEGERRLTILGYGRGHTESDLFVHLPDDGVVVAGDLVWAGVHPKTNDGFPLAWAEVLDRIATLGPTAVVPGHGTPGTSEMLAAMADYLRLLDEIVMAARTGELEPDRAEPPPGSEDWVGLGRFRRSLALLATKAD